MIGWVIGWLWNTKTNTAQALMSLFRETRGFEWRSKANWGSGLPCNQTWFGVSCDSNGNVISLSLPRNRLIGAIPSSLSGACALKTIQLHDNCTMLSSPPLLFSWILRLSPPQTP